MLRVIQIKKYGEYWRLWLSAGGGEGRWYSGTLGWLYRRGNGRYISRYHSHLAAVAMVEFASMNPNGRHPNSRRT